MKHTWAKGHANTEFRCVAAAANMTRVYLLARSQTPGTKISTISFQIDKMDSSIYLLQRSLQLLCHGSTLLQSCQQHGTPVMEIPKQVYYCKIRAPEPGSAPVDDLRTRFNHV